MGTLYSLAWNEEEKKRAQLWRVAAKGGEPQPLGISMEGRIRSLTIHPDGRQIAFSSGRTEWEVWAMENLLPMLQATSTTAARR